MTKFKHIFKAFWVLLFWLILSGTALAAFDLTRWQYSRDITVPDAADFVKITLPDDIAGGGNNFSDVRIITQGSNIEVPYFITRNAVVQGGLNTTSIINQTNNQGATSLILDTGAEGKLHTGINLDSSLSNYRRRVTVYSSSSLLPITSSSWNLVTDKGYIFKFTDPGTAFSSGKNTVDIPANTARYLKIVIDSGSEGPVAITSASVYGETRIDIPTYDKQVEAAVFNNPEKKTTEVTIDLGESGHITNAVTLNSNDRNYSRRVIVESSESASSSWKYVSQGSISSISTSLFTGTSLRVSYPEQKSRYLRISIVNDDNRPLTIDNKARIEGPIISAIFETRDNESYRLYYGNPSAQTPTYDIARISAYIETNKLPAGSLGPQISNPLYVAPAGPVVPFTEKYRMMLNVFLVAVVVLIGGGIGWYLRAYIKKKGQVQGFDTKDQGSA